jgi:antitoxin component YwqK of YwqJK toxin-antitoxin module
VLIMITLVSAKTLIQGKVMIMNKLRIIGLGLLFIFSINVSGFGAEPNLEKTRKRLLESTPETLEEAVQTVRKLYGLNASAQEIAQWVTRVVDERIISLNTGEANRFNETELKEAREKFDYWREKRSDHAATPYRSAYWAWENGIGHCEENTNTAYHILVMALPEAFAEGWSIKRIVNEPEDHTFAVLADIPLDPKKDQITPIDIRKWNAYIIDPWYGVSIPCEDMLYSIEPGTELYTRQGKWGPFKNTKLNETQLPLKYYQPLYENWLEDSKGADCHSPIPKEATQFRTYFREWWLMPDKTKVGPDREWYDKKKTRPKSLSCYNTEGKRHGPSIRWFRKGKKSSHEHFNEGTLDGLCRSWYEEPYKLASIIQYKEGKYHGIYQKWEKEGKSWIDKKYENGELRKETQYDFKGHKYITREGILEGYKTITGTIIKFFKNEQPMIYEEYKNGKRHGERKIWHEEPYRLKTLIQYKEGKHHGIYKTWSKDEIPLSDDFYENGELKKRTKYSNGKATEVLEYSNGKVVSSTKLETGKEQ